MKFWGIGMILLGGGDIVAAVRNTKNQDQTRFYIYFKQVIGGW